MTAIDDATALIKARIASGSRTYHRIAAAVEAEAAMPRLEREITRAVRAVQINMFEG